VANLGLGFKDNLSLVGNARQNALFEKGYVFL